MYHKEISILLCICVILFCVCRIACADGLTVSTTADSTGVVPGQVVNITSTLTNSFTASPPIELTATASYSVGLLPAETVTNSTVLILTKPISVPEITLPITSSFSYVSGSAKLDGTTIEVTNTSGKLSIPISKTLTEGQTARLTFQLKVQ